MSTNADAIDQSHTSNNYSSMNTHSTSTICEEECGPNNKPNFFLKMKKIIIYKTVSMTSYPTMPFKSSKESQPYSSQMMIIMNTHFQNRLSYSLIRSHTPTSMTAVQNPATLQIVQAAVTVLAYNLNQQYNYSTTLVILQ